MVRLLAAIQSIRDRVAMMVGRGVLAALDAGGGTPRATIKGVAGEVLGDREYTQDYGLSSRPHPGAEALMLFIGGLRSNGVAVRLFDGRYTMTLEYGEVAIHDDLGQRVHLTREGIVAESPIKIRVEAPDIAIHAQARLAIDCGGNGEVWTPTERHSYVIGSTGTSHPLHPPEVP